MFEAVARMGVALRGIRCGEGLDEAIPGYVSGDVAVACWDWNQFSLLASLLLLN
jgi:hypothetical protein